MFFWGNVSFRGIFNFGGVFLFGNLLLPGGNRLVAARLMAVGSLEGLKGTEIEKKTNFHELCDPYWILRAKKWDFSCFYNPWRDWN